MLQSLVQMNRSSTEFGRRMNAIRAEMENWMVHEYGLDILEAKGIENLYYDGVEEDDKYLTIAQSIDGQIGILVALRGSLPTHYPDCAPLRRLIKKIDTGVKELVRHT